MSLLRTAGLALAPLTLLALAAARPANAQVLTFEGLQNNETVGSYYNGGTGGNGSGPGPSDGITFGSNALALISNAAGGSGNFSNNPSGDTILYFLGGNAATMDVAAGFNTGFSFYYAGSQPGFVNVWSGLDDTGTLLATLNLAPTPTPYTVWAPVGVSFAGTAKSVDFGGGANYIGFDNITLNSSSPVPEASTTVSFGLMLALGLGGLAVAAKRKKQSA